MSDLTAAPSSADDANGDNIPAMKEKVAEGTAQMANGSNDSNGSGGKVKEVNGEENGGDGKSGGDDEDEEMMVDDDDMGEGVEEEDEVEEIGDDSEEEIITEENSIELDGEPSTGANSSVSGDDNAGSDSPQVISQQGGRSPHKRKAPIQVRDIEEIDSDDESNDVEEVQDDDDVEDEEEVDDSDSDIMEVEAEDPLSGGGAAGMEKKSAPNVVTIDDVKTLQRLANNAKKQDQQSAKENVVMIDTNAILAGKATSGVTITPARPKSSSSSRAAVAAMAAAGQKMPSGITISRPQASRGSPSASAAFGGQDAKGQLNDPNLTDDTHVVEAPSFIVPYIYEKPPKEKFEDFSKAVRDIMEKKDKEEREKRKQEREERRQKRKEEKKAKKKKKRRSSGGEDMDDGAVDDDDDEDFEGAEGGSGSESDGSKEDDDDVVAVFDESLFARKRSPKENFFEGTLGKFVVDLGMNLVEEVVQSDLLKQQIKRSQKDKSAGVMHAIRSLKASLEKSKDHNQPFKMELQKCSFCSFRTESELMMQHHLETPHMKNMMYRCNFCKYETRMPQEVMAHMQNEHAVRARLERAPAIHQCPQCPFEDNMKGKLSRHMKGCEKRYTPGRNQLPPHDWEPPAKVPKPPQTIQQRHGQMMGGRPPMMGGGGRIGNPLQQHKMYAGMPQLQMMGAGRGGRGGPYGQQFGQRLPSGLSMTRPGLNVAHAAAAQIRNMQQYGQQFNQNSILNNLSSNSSVTIQSVSNRGQNMGKPNKPSISITSLPGGPRQHPQSRHHPGMQPRNPAMMRSGPGGGPGPMRGPGGGMKPGFTPTGGATAMAGRGGKTDFVICEICDGYIKDLEQLRNHMLWIHKVKIHPKMIHNRPPLNCQKCQFRFFTDQGLERHLLGSHGLVTASMQDLANQNKDSGRCPVCGKVYQWKLLNHVAKDHQKTLKPAHLSYKCTVCTATFGQYRLFESHVYQAHSGKGKGGGGGGGSKQQQQQSVVKAAAATAAATKAPVQMSKDITIIPRPAGKPQASRPPALSAAGPDPDVIELDDEEEGTESPKKAKSSAPRNVGVDGQSQSSQGRRRQEVSEDDGGSQDGVEDVEDEEQEDE